MLAFRSANAIWYLFTNCTCNLCTSPVVLFKKMQFARSCSNSSFYNNTCTGKVTLSFSVRCFSIVHAFHCARLCQLAALLEAYNEVRSMLASSPGPLVAAKVGPGQSPASNDWYGTSLDYHNGSPDRSPDQIWLPPLVRKQED